MLTIPAATTLVNGLTPLDGLGGSGLGGLTPLTPLNDPPAPAFGGLTPLPFGTAPANDPFAGAGFGGPGLGGPAYGSSFPGASANPYAAPSAPSAPRKKPRQSRSASSQVSAPAIGMLVVAILSLLGVVLNIVLAVAQQRAEMDPRTIGALCGAVVSGILMSIVIKGAINMMQLSDYQSAKNAATICLLPCTCCWLGLPFGIWAHVVLNRDAVQDAFR